MISKKQLELAEYVKGVHLSLRRKARQIGAEKAWEEHLKNEEVLKNYADCMKNLAEEYWAANNDSTKCRIQWMVNEIENYFKNGNLQKEIGKENKKMKIFFEKGVTEPETEPEVTKSEFHPPYKLLDVGSCYNPFSNFNIFEPYPIDLYPASTDVKKCDFLEIAIAELKTDWFLDVKFLPENFFDVVVFSLFLEYLPSPKQRFLSCQKAYSCLKTNGLLLIATPDSKHASANSKIMKSWKIALSAIGFVRINLEKLRYIYCMTFRKASSGKYPKLLYNVGDMETPDEMIIIPQDSIDYNLEEEKNQKTLDKDDKKTAFEELPF